MNVKRNTSPMKKRIRGGLISKSLHIKTLAVLAVAAIATIASATTIDSHAEAVVGGTAQLTSNGSFTYGGSSMFTNRFVVDGKYTAYCSDPIKTAPAPGAYTVEEAHVHANKDGGIGSDAELQNVMYFGYGGPGFDPSMWPATYYDGSAWTNDKYYAVTHVLIANSMWYDGGYALRGTSEAFDDWVAWEFFGYHWHDHPGPGYNYNKDYWHTRAWAKRAELGGLGDYPVYQLKTYGGNHQTIVFAPALGNVAVQKKDIDTGNNVPKAGFEFRLLKSDKTTEVARKTSDDSGRVEFDNVITASYYIQETNAPSPYLLNNEMIPVTSTAAQTVTVNCSDKTPTGRVKVAKFDKYDDNKLSGAVFTVTSDNDVKRVDGSVIYKAGQVVDTITTGTDGTATSKELHIGADGQASFTVKETKAAPGHIINETPQKFTLKYKDMNTADLGTVNQTWKDDTNGEHGNKKLLETTVVKDDDTKDSDWTDSSSAKYSKIAAKFDSKCVGATFRLWNKSDEISVTPNSGKVGYALRIDGGKTNSKVTLYQKLNQACVSFASSSNGYVVVLVDEKGNQNALVVGKDIMIDPGTYTVKVKDSDNKDVTDFTGDKTLKVKAGDKATYSISVGSVTGKVSVSVKNEEISDRSPSVSTNYSQGYYYATSVKPNAEYSVKVDGKEIYVLDTTSDEEVKAGDVIYGRYSTTAAHYAYKRQPILLTSDSKFIDKFTINGKDYPVQTKIDKDGKIVIDRIVPGSYGFGETDVPFIGEDKKAADGEDNTATSSKSSKEDYSYLISPQRYYFTVDETTGRINGKQYDTPTFSNHVTSVSFTKKDITGDGELPGAHLEVRDSDNNLVDSWTSTDKPHTIIGLTPGKYKLIERITPNKYDQATRIDFTVTDSKMPQHVAMEDKPIHISAKLDKRQEIADPVADNTTANGDGKNRADMTKSDTGNYEYQLDYKNTSNTWVDEFTVYDSLDCVNQGLARLDSLMMAQGSKDYDGKLNVWYQTNKTPADYADDKDKANATTGDGHTNPWITGSTRGDDSKRTDPDGDGRALDYTGWKLWAKDVSATAASTLNVSDLHLADDEYITAFRLEYGRVEEGFTTRTSAWDRDDLKDSHDDQNTIEYVHEETFQEDSLDAVRSNIATLVSVLYDENGKLSDKAKKIIDDASDRIDEAVNSNDENAISTAISDIKDYVMKQLDSALSKANVKDSKSLDKAIDYTTAAYGRVSKILPKDVKSKFDQALAKAAKAVDSGDPEDIENARAALQGACDSAVDSLTTSVLSGEAHYAPAVARMHVTDAYTPGMNLANKAVVDAYRNGGGDGLEDHDSDEVVQVAKKEHDDLASDLVQTGIEIAPTAAVAIIALAAVAIVARKRRI